MSQSNSTSRVSHALTLLALSGLASPLIAGGESPGQRAGTLVPTHKAGVLYLNLDTGERTLTRYGAELVPEIDAARSSASLFDYWMSIDENPCWDDPRETGFAFLADSTTDVSSGITTSAVSWDFGDMPFDSKITGILVSTIVLHSETTDSNNDGVLDSGVDAMMVYYDALSEGHSRFTGHRSSIAPPTAVVRVDSIPGDNSVSSSPWVFDDYDIIVDFGVGNHFELGDSDGLNRGSMWLPGAAGGFDLSTLITTTTTTTTTTTSTTTGYFVNVNVNKTFHPGQVNPTPDGLADFQYLQYYVKHGGDEKVTSNSTFVGMATPTGGVTVINETTTAVFTTCTMPSGTTTTCTTVITIGTTILTPDPLPAGQGVFESIGFGSLVIAGDAGGVQSRPGLRVGCCYWFGGLDCAGFLNELVEDPPYNETWFEFTPYAQLSASIFSDAPSGTACDAVDYNNDGFVESGDISEFITLFLSSSPPADLNNDGFIDNGDIGAFIELFLGCSD